MSEKLIDGIVETEIDGANEVSATDETEIARMHPRTELHEIASATIYPQDGETGKPHCRSSNNAAGPIADVLRRPLT
jgi:hypothetical protein